MPSTYTLIKGETLASSAASYSFTAIPSTFTDLVLRVSLRSNTSPAALFQRYLLTFNGGTSGYSQTDLNGSGAAAASTRQTGLASIYGSDGYNTGSSTANTFSNNEIYIPNYTGSTSKPLSIFNATETNATNAYLTATAGLSTLGSGITSIAINPQTGTVSFNTGSSFYLYGIKNS